MSPGLDGGVVFSARAMPWLSAAGVIVASPATPSLASVVPTTGAGLAASMLPRRMKVSSLRLPKTVGSCTQSNGPIQIVLLLHVDLWFYMLLIPFSQTCEATSQTLLNQSVHVHLHDCTSCLRTGIRQN